MLWPLVFDEQNVIHFAHTSFLWSNLASNKAVVACVIIGLSPNPIRDRKIFDDGNVRIVLNISPYIAATDTVIVRKRTSVLSNIGTMQSGNKPTDDGNLILSTQEKEAIISCNRDSSRFIKRYVGSKEIINGRCRWCIWVEHKELEDAVRIEKLCARFEKVRKFRACPQFCVRGIIHAKEAYYAQ